MYGPASAICTFFLCLMQFNQKHAIICLLNFSIMWEDPEYAIIFIEFLNEPRNDDERVVPKSAIRCEGKAGLACNGF